MARAARAIAEQAQVTERKQARRLLVVLVVISGFFFFELLGARAAGSDVLKAAAYHLLMDVFALGISLGAMRVASRRPNARFTFGMRRAESMAALVNGVLVFAVAVELLRDAWVDLANPVMPRSGLMLVVASAALVVNGLSAWLIHSVMGVHLHGHEHSHGHEHAHHDQDDHAHGVDSHDHSRCDDHAGHDPAEEDEGDHAAAHAHHLNLRGAWLHLMGDALGSLAAFAAGLAIRFGAPPVVDPLASLVVVAILVVGAVRLLRDAGYVLLEAAPPHLPVDRLRRTIAAFPGVQGIHSLHVWSLGTGHDAVTVHVTSSGSEPKLGTRLGDVLRARFHVEYVTVQVDVADD